MKRISISFFLFAWLVMLILAAQQLFAQTPTAKSVIINEWSQGNTVQVGGQYAEWVELLVVGNVSAGDTLLDLAGLRLQKEAGTQANYIEFGSNALWVDVPRGSIIVIYNGNRKSTALGADDLTFGADNKVIIPHNQGGTYFTLGGTTWGATDEMFAQSFSATAQPVLRHQPSTTDIFVWGSDGAGSSAYPGTDQLVYYTSHYNGGTFSTVTLWEVKYYTSGYPGRDNTGDNATFITAMLNNRPSISIVTTSPVTGAQNTTLYFIIRLGYEVPASRVKGVSFKFYRGSPESFRVTAGFYGTPYPNTYNLFGDGGANGVANIDTVTEPGIVNYATIRTGGTIYNGSGGSVTRIELNIQPTVGIPTGNIVNFFLTNVFAVLGTTSPGGYFTTLTQFVQQTNVQFFTPGTGGLVNVVGKGDSDHSTVVNATDVTALASRFGEQGGAYSLPWTTCSKVTRDQWGVDAARNPNAVVLAMWCDHNGDGRVDNLDVLAIGLCFGTNYSSYPKLIVRSLPLSSSNLSFKIVDEFGNLVTRPLQGKTYQYVYSVKDAVDLSTISFYMDWDNNIEVLSYKVSDAFKSGTIDFIEFIKLWSESQKGVVALGRVWYDGAISGDEIEVIRFNVRVADNARNATVNISDSEIRNLKGDLFALKSSPGNVNITPVRFALEQNYPNPFNPSTKISFELPEAAKVSLTIYNSLGQLIARVISNESMDAGRYEKIFDASDIASGIYLYKLSTDRFTATKKMVYLR